MLAGGILPRSPMDRSRSAGRCFLARWVVAGENIDCCPESCVCARFRHLLLHQLQRGEHDPLAGPRYMGKESMLDRIEFGATGRIMSDPDFQIETIRQLLQVVLENLAP